LAHQLAITTSIKNLKADPITKQDGLFTLLQQMGLSQKSKREPETSYKNLNIIILLVNFFKNNL